MDTGLIHIRDYLRLNQVEDGALIANLIKDFVSDEIIEELLIRSARAGVIGNILKETNPDEAFYKAQNLTLLNSRLSLLSPENAEKALIYSKFVTDKIGLPEVEQELSKLQRSSIVSLDTNSNLSINISKSKGAVRLISILIVVILATVVANRLFSVKEERIGQDYLQVEIISPESLIVMFFTLINNKKFEEAYLLTDNIIWSPLDSFATKHVWGGFDEIRYIRSKKKYYPSKFGAEYILNVEFEAKTSSTNQTTELDYDFHFQKQGSKWKIVRMIYPQLNSIDRPNNAKDCVRKFLDFLDQGEYLKAYLLTENKNWGSRSRFISKNEGFGCISEIKPFAISEVEIDSKYGTKVVFAKYYAQDHCNDSGVFEYYFHLDHINDYWKIVRATNPN